MVDPRRRHSTIDPTRGELLMEWGTSTDGITVLRRGPRTLHTRARGKLSGDVMQRFIALLDKLVAEGVRGMVVFHDFSAVESYEPEMRQQLTEWRKRTPPGTTAAVHVLVKSKIIAMGVAASGMILRLVGIELRSYSDGPSFEQAMRRAVEADAR